MPLWMDLVQLLQHSHHFVCLNRVSCLTSILQWMLVVWPTPFPPPSCRMQWQQQRWAVGQVSMLQLARCSRGQRSALAAVTRATWLPGGSRPVAIQVDKPETKLCRECASALLSFCSLESSLSVPFLPACVFTFQFHYVALFLLFADLNVISWFPKSR